MFLNVSELLHMEHLSVDMDGVLDALGEFFRGNLRGLDEGSLQDLELLLKFKEYDDLGLDLGAFSAFLVTFFIDNSSLSSGLRKWKLIQ